MYRTGATTLGGSARVIYHRDGKTATVAVFDHGAKGQEIRRIATNGKVDAGIALGSGQPASPDESTTVLLAALPLSMREQYERVGVIGFGSDMTTHTLMGHDKVGRVDTVEIKPAMIEGARHFGPHLSRAFTDPRSH